MTSAFVAHDRQLTRWPRVRSTIPLRSALAVPQALYGVVMVASTWDHLVRDLNDEDKAKLAAYRDFCRGLPDVQERVSSAQVAYAGTRIFTSAYIKSHYLELGIELLREVDDPRPRTSFPTSRNVFMHRYSLPQLEQFNGPIRALIREAAQTVGPGLRRTKTN